MIYARYYCYFRLSLAMKLALGGTAGGVSCGNWPLVVELYCTLNLSESDAASAELDLVGAATDEATICDGAKESDHVGGGRGKTIKWSETSRR